MKLNVNDHASGIVCVAELRQALAPFASQQFREIWVSMEADEPNLCALMNTNVGWLMYLRHNEGDPGFSSRNPMYDESDSIQSGLAFDSMFNGRHVPVINYQLSNGQLDEYPATGRCRSGTSCAPWNTSSSMTAVTRHLYNGTIMLSLNPCLSSLKRRKRARTVVLQAGQMKLEVIREVRFFAGLGLKEAKDLVEGAPKNVKEGVGRNEAEKIKAALEEVGATVEIKYPQAALQAEPAGPDRSVPTSRHRLQP